MSLNPSSSALFSMRNLIYSAIAILTSISISTAATKIYGFRVLKETPESINLEIDYELDASDGDVRIETQAIFSDIGTSQGYFGYTPALVSPGRHKTTTSLGLNGIVA